MSEYLLAAALIVFACGGIVWLMNKASNGSRCALLVLGIAVIILLACLLRTLFPFGVVGTCLQYETRLMFNAATKTAIPVRICVQYAELNKEIHE